MASGYSRVACYERVACTRKRSASRMAPPVAVADVYLPRGALEMQPRLKACRAFEITSAARPPPLATPRKEIRTLLVPILLLLLMQGSLAQTPQVVSLACNAGYFGENNAVEYKGLVYRTLDGMSLFDTNFKCQNYYLPLPSGWALAADNADSRYIIGAYRWGTDALVVANGHGYRGSYWAVTAQDTVPRLPGTYHGSSFLITFGPKYKVIDCYPSTYLLILISKSGSACTACPPGKYGTATGQTTEASCTTCPTNSTSPAGSAVLTNCSSLQISSTLQPLAVSTPTPSTTVTPLTAVATTTLSISTPSTSTSLPAPATPSPTTSSSQQPQCQSRIRNLVRVCGRDGSSICRTAQKSRWGGVTSNKAIDGNLLTMSEVSEYDWSKGIGIGITDPWWRVELALSSVFNVTLTLPDSATTGPLSMYVGNSTDYVGNVLCVSNLFNPDTSSSVQFQVPCSGVGRYLHIVMAGSANVMRLTEVEVTGCHLEAVPSASRCPAGFSSWDMSTGTCKACPVGWTTDSNVAGPDMWQGCNVPCSLAMMNDVSTGCRGAWYKTLAWPDCRNCPNSCRDKCTSVGLQCNLESLKFVTTFDRAKSVYDLMGESSTCSSANPPIGLEYSMGVGPGQINCGGCTKSCGYDEVVSNDALSHSHQDFKHMCPCGPQPAASVSSLCMLGYFGPDGNTCTACVAGKYSGTTIGATACTACGAGKYGVATGQTAEASCTVCGAGKYRVETGGSAEESCTVCGTGKYGTATGQTSEVSCTACGAGKYGVETGGTAEASCTACGAGKYRVETGGSAEESCTVCGTGKYGTATGQTSEASCTACGAGKYGMETGGTAEASCTACGAGKYGVATGQPAEESCTVCVSGKYRVETGGSAEESCTACGAGKYGTATGQPTEASCKPCSVGTYSFAGASAATNASDSVQVCVVCAAGKISTEIGTSSCTNCPAGKYNADVARAAGNHDAVEDCTICSVGTYSSAGASSCLTCPPNSNSVPGSTSVTDCTCSAGSTGPSGGPCLQCAAGKFKVASGTDICTNCIIGKYGAAGAVAETECRTCPAGKFGGREGSSQCTDCEAGKVSDGGGWVDIACNRVTAAATHVVKLTLSLPLTKNEFTTDKQSKFREAIAAAAGAKSTDVTIDRIDTIVNVGRRLLSEYVLVYTSVMASDAMTADGMANSLTVDKINASLDNTGLPKATIKQTATVETVSTFKPVESVNTITAPLIGGIVGGLVLLIVFVTGASVYLRYLTKDTTRRFHNAVDTLDTNHDGHISEVRYIAFLSHDRGRDRLDRDNHARVLRIKDSMHSRGVPVWIDDDQLSGHIDAKVCEGIDQSSVVLLFVTKNFMLKVGGKSQRGEGDFCLLEFNYAKLNKTSKKMLCVVMEPQCLNQLEWSGPLMMHMGGSLFFDFSTDDDFEGKMDDLVKMMKEIVSSEEWEQVTRV